MRTPDKWFSLQPRMSDSERLVFVQIDKFIIIYVIQIVSPRNKFLDLISICYGLGFDNQFSLRGARTTYLKRGNDLIDQR